MILKKKYYTENVPAGVFIGDKAGVVDLCGDSNTIGVISYLKDK